jgi:hypothetical protein
MRLGIRFASPSGWSALRPCEWRNGNVLSAASRTFYLGRMQSHGLLSISPIIDKVPLRTRLFVHPVAWLQHKPPGRALFLSWVQKNSLQA